MDVQEHVRLFLQVPLQRLWIWLDLLYEPSRRYPRIPGPPEECPPIQMSHRITPPHGPIQRDRVGWWWMCPNCHLTSLQFSSRITAQSTYDYHQERMCPWLTE